MAKDTLQNGGGLTIGLELDEGQTIGPLQLGENNESEIEHLKEFGNIIHVIECYKKIAEKYHLPAPIYDYFEISADDYDSLTYASNLLNGEDVSIGEHIKSFAITTNLSTYNEILKNKEKGNSNLLRFCNKNILPKLFEFDLKSLKLERIYFDMDVGAKIDGEIVKLKFKPNANSKSVSCLSITDD
ncbi:hypothetical protein FJQ87_07690 [Shewanella sp. SNU WT4]|uniref:hypothetical protein n=1 Tax=Shewanella sp. SNU WT4 TaxID=2590015 RepID=UPI0011292BFA|nr:hypothetical protein [Shewanella sp. SNU WT4]QDF66606.1 hypothetical protein FJQ87_07690 [Shewanella sp. SNU WT4]